MWPRSVIVLMALCLGVNAQAEPFVPRDDSLVVLRIEGTREQSAIAALERQVAADGADVVAVHSLVDAYLERGRLTAEPRYFGRAEALLTPWLEQPQPSAALLLQMADIRQYRHEYERALSLLDRVIESEPGLVQGRLMRASIQQTQGQFIAAHADCRWLLGHGETTLGTACLAQVIGMTGSLTKAERLMTALVERSGDLPASQRAWMLTALADMSDRLGRVEIAAASLEEALAIDPQDHYARLALADLLLETERENEVAGLLAQMPRTEGALLRLAEVGLPENSAQVEDVAALKARYKEAQLRGERLHLRDLARLHLRLPGDQQTALALARENWKEQREPADARLLAQAALAAEDAASIEFLEEWRRETRYEDHTLDRLLRSARKQS